MLTELHAVRKRDETDELELLRQVVAHLLDENKRLKLCPECATK